MSANPSSRTLWPVNRTRTRPYVHVAAYAVLVFVPLALSIGLPLYGRPFFQSLVTALNIAGLSALLWQFLLSSRSRLLDRSWGADPALAMHRRVGEWIAIFFFLHPFLILLPRTWVAGHLALDDLWLSLTQKSIRTGLFAWALLLVWTLIAIAKRKARLSYEAWRYSHAVGFLAVAVLGVLHAMDVGRHGQSQPLFNIFWIVGLTLAVGVTLYGLGGRPGSRARHVFKVDSVTPAGSSDWSVRLRHVGDKPFAFTSGQFVWLDVSRQPWLRSEHPFSIASAPADLPMLELVVRNLGDFTAQLGRLQPGRRVTIEGPYGHFTLAGREAAGVVMLAGGAGIGPMLSLLRSLTPDTAPFPVRLLYGNRRADQMVAGQELAALSKKLPDFAVHYALEEANDALPFAFNGRMDRAFLKQHLPDAALAENWLAFVCGPPLMVQHSLKELQGLGWPKDRIVYERFGF